jgi:hypothetical protein
LVADTDDTDNRPRDPEPLASATSPTFHAWDRLPEELKLEVLSHNLTFEESIGAYIHKQYLQSTLYPLIGTRNRHLASLAQEVCYKTNQFKININDDLEHPKPRTAAMMRHLHVDIFKCLLFSPPDPDIMVEASKCLFKLQEPFECRSEQGDQTNSESGLHWQTTFTGLQTLKLTWYARRIEIQLLPSECCCSDPATRWKAIKDWLGKTEMLLRARKVECEMHAQYLRPAIGWQLCRAHDDVLKHLEDMATKE